MESKQRFSGYVENVTWLMCLKECLQNCQTDLLPLPFCKTHWVEDKNVAARGIAVWLYMIITSLNHNGKGQKISL